MCNFNHHEYHLCVQLCQETPPCLSGLQFSLDLQNSNHHNNFVRPVNAVTEGIPSFPLFDASYSYLKVHAKIDLNIK